MDPKEINKTSFCGKQVDNIISNDMKKYIIDDMKLRTSLTPSSRYAKIYNEAYKKNFKNPHILCLKTYGSPYFLYMTLINGFKYTLLIDKKIKNGYDYPKMFIIPYSFNEELYNGSLFETELLRDNNNKWFLLLGDIYYYKGKKTNNINIVDRVKILNNILENEFIEDKEDICQIEIKKYFDIVDKDIVFNNFIPKLNYKTRGLYFVPININYSNVLYMFNENELKKIYESKIIDNIKNLNFKIIKTNKPEIYELYLKDKDTITKVDTAHISGINNSKYINNLFNNKDNDDDIIVYCEYNTFFKKWTPIKKTDKLIHHINDLALIN